ncbi:HNH endonuclease [candidate division KSB1 bacterium]|nr:HNH endonuclease [candidate division KSB1 bacterium]
MPKRLLVCHNCDNPSCVNPSHLFIGTQKDNIQDSVKKNRWKARPPIYFGEKNNKSKLKTREVWLIKKILKAKIVSQNYIAKMFKISPQTISKINRNEYWKGVVCEQ